MRAVRAVRDVPIQVDDTTRTLGVYLPPGYDANRAEPYKTIYMQHGGGQDQSDWMNIGSVPVIMDNLLEDGLTEPAVVVTTATDTQAARTAVRRRNRRFAVSARATRGLPWLSGQAGSSPQTQPWVPVENTPAPLGVV